MIETGGGLSAGGEGLTYDPRDPDRLIESWRESPEPTQSKASEPKSKTPYRTFPESLAHDASFQSLTPHAKLVFFFLRLQLGASGIDVFYPEQLPRQTGLRPVEVQEAIAQLKAAGWLETGGNIFWLIDALGDDPTSLTLNNLNHRKSIQKHIKSLPRQPIVNRFADHYMLDLVFPELHAASHPESHRDPIPDQGTGERRYETGEIGISGKKRTRAEQRNEGSPKSKPLLAATDLPATTCPSCDGPKPADRPLCETCEYTRRNSVGAAGGRSRDGRHEPGDRS